MNSLGLDGLLLVWWVRLVNIFGCSVVDVVHLLEFVSELLEVMGVFFFDLLDLG